MEEELRPEKRGGVGLLGVVVRMLGFEGEGTVILGAKALGSDGEEIKNLEIVVCVYIERDYGVSASIQRG